MNPYRSMPAILALLGLAGCTAGHEIPRNELLDRYIAAANRHDLDTLSQMLTDDAVWYLGSDTLRGKDTVLGPTRFDQGANTTLEVQDVTVRGDTVDFELIERNDVLTALGIGQLHHFPRFVYRGDRIAVKRSRHAPLEIQTFMDSVMAFARWLHTEKPEEFGQLWPGGKFNYSAETGAAMPELIRAWRARGEKGTEPTRRAHRKG